MAEELMIKNNGLAAVVEQKQIGDVIKPLVNEIHLFDTYVAGTTHRTKPCWSISPSGIS